MERMETKLTPNKIMRLLQLAEATTPQQGPAPGRARRRVLAERNTLEVPTEPESSGDSKYTTRCGSSGLLDLDQCEVFGESCMGELDKFSVGMSFSNSRSFNPGEMTGRSTGTSECAAAAAGAGERCRESSAAAAAVEELAARLQQQSCDVADIVRNSIYNYSFQTQRDLSRDEASFIRENAPLPVPQAQLDLNLTRATDKKTEQSYRADTTSDMSVGSYFMKGSADLAKMIGRSDSPQYEVSMAPSLIEGDSRTYGVQPGFTTINDSDCGALDATLDRVPTRQPRAAPAPLAPRAAAAALAAPALQHLAPAAARSEDSSLALDSTLSISLIAKCLGKCDADVTPSMLFTEAKLNKKASVPKPTLPGREPNALQKDTFTITSNAQSRPVPHQPEDPLLVTTLKQAGKSDTASSASSVNTVVNVPIGKANKENVAVDTPKPVASLLDASRDPFAPRVDMSPLDSAESRTKSSVGKSSRSACTVQENRISTSNVEGSPLQSSSGEVLWPGLSPNFNYRELEHSVDWQELMLLTERLNKVRSRWVDVELEPVEGYVGMRVTVAVKLTSVTDSWMSARLRLDDSRPDDSSVVVDVPRFPVLLSPGAADTLILTVTAFEPLRETLALAVLLKDTCEDTESQQETQLHLNFVLPGVKIVTPQSDGVLRFPPTQFDGETVKSFVVANDCSEALNLALSVTDNPAVFSIGHVEVMKMEDVERRLASDQRLVTEEGMVEGCKYRAMKANSKTVCTLPQGKALRVMMICHAPSNTGSDVSKLSVNGSLGVHLVGTDVLLQTVPMSADVGTIKLQIQMNGNKLYITNDSQTVEVRNVGSVAGAWRAGVRGACARHLDVSPALLQLPAGGVGALRVAHTRIQHVCQDEGLLVLESVHEGAELLVELVLGPEQPVGFPIKTTHRELAWVREGRLPLSLKNASARRVAVRCRVVGAGFRVEAPRAAAADELALAFAPGECVLLSVVYCPRERGLHKAKFVLCLEEKAGPVKSVAWPQASPERLHETVQHYCVQYRSLAASARVTPERGVLAPRGSVQLTLELDWPRLERLLGDAGATTLASLFVLVGAEVTRRRILKILREEPNTTVTASPAEDLARLQGPFVGEDPKLDLEILDFDETKNSLAVLTGSIQELTAQIELARDNGAERTILLADETSVEHHTLLD